MTASWAPTLPSPASRDGAGHTSSGVVVSWWRQSAVDNSHPADERRPPLKTFGPARIERVTLGSRLSQDRTADGLSERRRSRADGRDVSRETSVVNFRRNPVSVALPPPEPGERHCGRTWRRAGIPPSRRQRTSLWRAPVASDRLVASVEGRPPAIPGAGPIVQTSGAICLGRRRPEHSTCRRATGGARHDSSQIASPTHRPQAGGRWRAARSV